MVQRIHLRLTLLIFILIAFVFSYSAFAEIKVFEKEESAVVGQDQSQNQVEAMLWEQAKISALEEAGTYISTFTVVKNYQLQKDEVTAMAAGILSSKKVGFAVFEPIDSGRHVKIKVKFRVDVDTSVLDRRVEDFMKEKGALKREEEAMKKVRELQDQLAKLKSTEVKGLEELNAQAIALERERDRQRLLREEQAIKAKRELSKAEEERFAKEREMQERISRTLAEQEKAKREEADALAAEQDRIKRAQLENEQRWNDLSRQAKLSQDSWTNIDDSLSLKQATAEVKDLKKEIANLKNRLDYQYQANTANLKKAYAQQRDLSGAKLPPAPAPKDAFESSEEYNNRLAINDRQVKAAKAAGGEAVEKLEKEETLKLAEAKVDYLGQQIRVLMPFVERLGALQARKFILPEGGDMTVELGEPDADHNRFPLALQYKDRSWTAWWNYNDRDRARDFYRTRTHLKAEGLFQIEEGLDLRPRLTVARVSHLASRETRDFTLETPDRFGEIRQFAQFQRDEETARTSQKKAAKMLTLKVIARDGSFIAYDDGTVLDTRTNLMWAAKDNGSNINWNDAKRFCEKYRGGGYADWRMPTLDELANLYDKSKKNRHGHHVTDLIEITDRCPWASETRGSEAAHFYFSHGGRYWSHQSYDYSTRALPVRLGK
jgi:hypothetical protein